MTTRCSLAIALVVAGCGSLGKSGEFSELVLNGGTGPFRLATVDETGVQAAPVGSFVAGTDTSVGRAHAETDVVFYAVASRLASPPPRDVTLPRYAVDEAQFGRRRIARSFEHAIGTDGTARLGFQTGPDVLAPSEPWEANGVYDPAIVRRPDGSVLLYYGTEHGLGIAQAPSIDGSFVRVTSSPLFEDVEGRGPAQAPSVITLASGKSLLYFSVAGSIFLARSDDGLAFELVDSDETTPAIDPLALASVLPGITTDSGVEIVETGLASPSAVVTRSHIGRELVRLYFESRASDQTVAIHAAGSFDGYHFERSPIVAYKKNDPTSPSAFLSGDGITRLTFVVPDQRGGFTFGALVLASAPAERMLPLP